MEPPLPSSPDTQDNEPSLTRRSSRSSVTSNEPTLTRRRSSSTTSSVDPSEIASTKFESPFDATLAAARKRSQHEKLWEMFATYALQMSSEDPTRMRVNVVVKLLQDCGVIDASNSEEAKMIEKEVKIVCDSFLKNVSSDRDVTKRMDFTAFLKLLMHFAEMSDGQDPARAYDSLVRTCLEKQQKPRVRVSVTKDMQECKKVLQAFDEPLSKIFALYAGASHTKLEKLDPKMAQISPPHMGYGECLAFARKYGVIAHGLLTTTEFSTIYIDSLAKAPMNEYERVLTYEGFGELMVRLSRKACRGEHLTPEKRLKGLFQLMWLASSSTSPRALQITDVLKSNRVDVTKLFLLHFEKFWRKENYENYMGDRCLHDTEDMEPTTNPDGTIPPPAPTSTNSTKRRISLCVQSTSTPNITTSSPIIIATSTKIATSPTKSATNSPSTQSPSKRQSVNPGSAGKTPTKVPVRRATMQTNIIS